MFGEVKLFLLIVGLFLFEACDPGFGVYIVNKTNNDIKVKVLFEKDQPLNHYKDSVCFSDTLFTDSLSSDFYCIAAIKDSIDGSYFFEVGKYRKAAFEGGQGVPDKKQMIIVDEKDTLSFENDNRLVRAGSFMSKQFIFTIK